MVITFSGLTKNILRTRVQLQVLAFLSIVQQNFQRLNILDTTNLLVVRRPADEVVLFDFGKKEELTYLFRIVTNRSDFLIRPRRENRPQLE